MNIKKYELHHLSPCPPINIEVKVAFAATSSTQHSTLIRGEGVSHRHVRTDRKKGEVSQLILSRVVASLFE